MILDKIENSHLYNNLSAGVKKALGILKDKKILQQKDGRYEVEGDNLFYIVQRYTTKPLEEGLLEAHKKYIDVQFIAEGEELLVHANIQNLKINKPYNPETDAAFYDVPENANKLSLTANTFCILYPHDTHMPCRQLNGPAEVLKVVVKVKVDAK